MGGPDTLPAVHYPMFWCTGNVQHQGCSAPAQSPVLLNNEKQCPARGSLLQLQTTTQQQQHRHRPCSFAPAWSHAKIRRAFNGDGTYATCSLVHQGHKSEAAQQKASLHQNHPASLQNPEMLHILSRDGMPSLTYQDEEARQLKGISTHAAIAWEHWKKLGEPKLIVAPMLDQSELPFRMLCRKYGATAAYTPMLHARLFVDDPNYRVEFTTCLEDRPLFVQFCANDSEKLLTAAKMVESQCDYVDINLGCPQRVAKRGKYGAFLMNDLPLIKSLVQKLASNLSVPVSCKIRIFPNLEDTLAYARMLEEAGCSLLAVHGRTRDQKDSKRIRADWCVIKAVKEAIGIPVLANGNIRSLDDVSDCLRETGADGVMSAISLLENPALFAGYQVAEPAIYDGYMEEHIDMQERPLDQLHLLLEYLDMLDKYPAHPRMVRSHVYSMLGSWFRLHNDAREQLNNQSDVSREFLEGLVRSLANRNERIYLLPPKP